MTIKLHHGDLPADVSFGATVAILGWLLLRHPLTALASWLRRQPGLKVFFAEPEGSLHAPADTGGVPSRP